VSPGRGPGGARAPGTWISPCWGCCLSRCAPRRGGGPSTPPARAPARPAMPAPGLLTARPPAPTTPCDHSARAACPARSGCLRPRAAFHRDGARLYLPAPGPLARLGLRRLANASPVLVVDTGGRARRGATPDWFPRGFRERRLGGV